MICSLSEYYTFKKLGSTDVHPKLKEAIQNIIGWNQGIEKCVKMLTNLGQEIAEKGYVRSDKLLFKRTGLIEKTILHYYYPGRPKIVSKEVFEIISKKNLGTFYRGVSKEKYADELMFSNKSFTGTDNFVVGTWITDDKKYALEYAEQQESGANTLLEMTLSKDIKFCEDEAVQKCSKDLRDSIFQIKQWAFSQPNDKYELQENKSLIHTCQFAMQHLVHNTTFLCCVLGFEAYDEDRKDNRVYVIFNKERLIVKGNI